MQGLAWPDLALILLAIFVAYTFFGITGFGAVLISSPVLAFFMPISLIIPALAILDVSAAVSNVAGKARSANFSELKRLVPLMVLGSLIGATILLKTRPDILLPALGIFVVGYSLYALSGLKPHAKFKPVAAVPFGIIGGIFSALFGSGGFIYAIYLSGRIEHTEGLRITQTTLIGLSALTRVMLFAFAGVYANISLWMLIGLLAPAMLLGIFVGRHITLKISKAHFLKLMHWVVLCSGLMLLVRYFSSLA